MEVKAGDNGLTDHQARWHDQELAAGGLVFTVRSGAEAHKIVTWIHAQVDRGIPLDWISESVARAEVPA
jgi:hypothetical protein